MEKINYTNLNSRQKELYNYHKISSILADYGFFTIKISDDWESADFIAMHCFTKDFIKVQLKGCLSFAKKYINKDLIICFQDRRTLSWYMYPHDEILEKLLNGLRDFSNTDSWKKEDGMYTFPSIPSKLFPILNQYKIEIDPQTHK